MEVLVGNHRIARRKVAKSQNYFSSKDAGVVRQKQTQRSVGRWCHIHRLLLETLHMTAPKRAALNQKFKVKSIKPARNKGSFGERIQTVPVDESRMFFEPLKKMTRSIRIRTHAPRRHVQQVEWIVSAVGHPRSYAATLLDQSNLARARKRLREMYCDHRPAKTRAYNCDVDIMIRPREYDLVCYHD